MLNKTSTKERASNNTFLRVAAWNLFVCLFVTLLWEHTGPHHRLIQPDQAGHGAGLLPSLQGTPHLKGRGGTGLHPRGQLDATAAVYRCRGWLP